MSFLIVTIYFDDSRKDEIDKMMNKKWEKK